MLRPGAVVRYAVGCLACEGVIEGPDEVCAAGPPEDLAANVVEVRTSAGLRRDPSAERRFYLSSSCGVCGKGALEFVRQEAPPAPAAPPLEPSVVLVVPEETRRRQQAFERTGGLHATALFEASGDL